MKYTFVFLRTGISGGTGTLSIRLSENLIERGYKVIYICQEINDNNNAQSLKKLGVQIHKWKESEISKNILQTYGSEESYIFMSYSLSEFLMIESMKKDIHIHKNILYVVHQYGLTKGYGAKTWFRKVISRFHKGIVSEMLKSKCVIFMDDFIHSFTREYYNLNFNNQKTPIINLPMVVNEFDFEGARNKLELNNFNILTISRAEFPFKGYIIGLINEFQKLCELYNDIELTIITFGEDVEKIHKELDCLSVEVKGKIHVYGQTSYDKLMDYFNRAHLYIGMGSTILDAANHSTPSLIVSQYTYDCFTSGLFHAQPNLLIALENSSKNIKPYVENIKNMKVKEYTELCAEEHRALFENYNMNSFFDYLERDSMESRSMLFSNYKLVSYRLITGIGYRLKKLRKNVFKERKR